MPPAGRLTGSAPDWMVNAFVELLNSEILSVEVPGFVMVTFCDTAFPTFTSPNSTAEGLKSIEPALVPVEEDDLGFPPQPASPRLNARPTMATGAATSELSVLLLFLARPATPGRTAEILS